MFYILWIYLVFFEFVGYFLDPAEIWWSLSTKWHLKIVLELSIALIYLHQL